MSIYLVTGGAGFIGSHIVEALVSQGEKVRVLDNFAAGKRENLAGVLDKIELIEGDIRDLDLLKKVTEGVDFVLHQGALRSVPKSVENPLLYNEVNVGGALNVLLASRDAKVKQVVCASSSSIYGELDVLPQRENHLPQLISPYAASKLAGEYYCRVFSKIYGLSCVSLRYFNVFGPRQSLESEYAVVIPKFITAMLNDESPPIHGDGTQTRDFTFVANVVKANLLAAATSNISGEVFNIACGRDYSVLDIVTHLNRLMHKDLKPKFTPPRPGDVPHTRADISKAKQLLGLKIEVDFESGLRRTLDWFRGRKIRGVSPEFGSVFR